MCGSAIAMIDPSSDAVKAMRHREAMTSQKDVLCEKDSGVVFSSPETLSIECVGDGIVTIRHKERVKEMIRTLKLAQKLRMGVRR